MLTQSRLRLLSAVLSTDRLNEVVRPQHNFLITSYLRAAEEQKEEEGCKLV